MEPIPVGTLVDYHGSHAHGRYILTAHQKPRDGIPDPGKHYPDGVAYVIWDARVPPSLRKLGNAMYSVYQVRRTSLTVL